MVETGNFGQRENTKAKFSLRRLLLASRVFILFLLIFSIICHTKAELLPSKFTRLGPRHDSRDTTSDTAAHTEAFSLTRHG